MESFGPDTGNSGEDDPTINPYRAGLADPAESDLETPVLKEVHPERVHTPALCLLASCVLMLLLWIPAFGLAAWPEGDIAETGKQIFVLLVLVALPVLCIWGCICILRFKHLGWAYLGCVAGLLCGLACCLVPSFFALWTLVDLGNDDIQQRFNQLPKDVENHP